MNKGIVDKRDHIQVSFDTQDEGCVDTALLQLLFTVGLRSAALEVFLSQVIETLQYFFHEGNIVERSSLQDIQPDLFQKIDAIFEPHDEVLTSSLSLPVELDEAVRRRLI